MDYQVPEVEIYGFVAGVVEKKELIRILVDELSDEMSRDMMAHAAATWVSVRRETKEYSLLSVRQVVSEKVQLPQETKLELRGYELLLNTGTPLLVRFGQGLFWIDRRSMVVCYKEEILAWFPYLIDKLLPGTLMQWREKRASVEKELLIQLRLAALERMYKEAVK